MPVTCASGEYGSVLITNPESEALASMGWVGFVKASFGGTSFMLRCNSIDINASQEITTPDVLDGTIDRTVYQLGPMLVEGTLSMPVIADTGAPGTSYCAGSTICDAGAASEAATLLENIWCWSTARSVEGRPAISDGVQLDVRYANQAAYGFNRVIVNTLGMSATQQDQVGFDINVIGRGRIDYNEGDFATTPAFDPILLSPARVLTWNDISVSAQSGCDVYNNSSDHLFNSNQVREFNMEVNNNADRFFTLNGSLFPADINVGKREITGAVTLMGLNIGLRDLARSNAARFNEKNRLGVALYVGQETWNDLGAVFSARDWWINGLGCAIGGGAIGDEDEGNMPGGAIWGIVFRAVVFQIEEIASKTDLLETTVNWTAMATDETEGGDDVERYRAFAPDTSPGYPLWGV